ncbi:TPA: HNH endonuclease [Citrobacter koseri]|nr:HNH endonuclease [Citrobacter koseri]
MKDSQTLTQQALREYLVYEPHSGIFTWIKKTNIRIIVGDHAGSIDRYGYIRIKLFGGAYKAHRLAWFYMTGKWPQKGIDHVNGIKHDNSWVNLREANQMENMRNTGPHKRNTSGYKGVTYHKGADKWSARIRYGGKRHHLGIFSTPEEAAKAYELAAKQNHGEFVKSQSGSIEMITGQIKGVNHA